MALILAIIIALLLVGTVPIWPHSIHWGYYPSGSFGLVLTILIIYIILKRA